jgi:hypothetical protein
VLFKIGVETAQRVLFLKRGISPDSEASDRESGSLGRFQLYGMCIERMNAILSFITAWKSTSILLISTLRSAVLDLSHSFFLYTFHTAGIDPETRILDHSLQAVMKERMGNDKGQGKRKAPIRECPGVPRGAEMRSTLYTPYNNILTQIGSDDHCFPDWSARVPSRGSGNYFGLGDWVTANQIGEAVIITAYLG